MEKNKAKRGNGSKSHSPMRYEENYEEDFEEIEEEKIPDNRSPPSSISTDANTRRNSVNTSTVSDYEYEVIDSPLKSTGKMNYTTGSDNSATVSFHKNKLQQLPEHTGHHSTTHQRELIEKYPLSSLEVSPIPADEVISSESDYGEDLDDETKPYKPKYKPRNAMYGTGKGKEYLKPIESTNKSVDIMRNASPNLPAQQSLTPLSNSVNKSASKGRSSARTSSAHKQMDWIKNDQWKLGEKLGQGSFGEVFQCLAVDSGKLYAVKKMYIGGKLKEVEGLIAEIDLMRRLKHENIVRYFGAKIDEDNGIVYIFLEWVPGGSLAHMLKRFGPFSYGTVRAYTRQILLGLEYLHNNGVIHRDIKGGNVLVKDDGLVKLADFGASTTMMTNVDGSSFSQTQVTSTVKGTPYFMAPEVLSESHYGRRGDIWAVGCTMIQMISGEPPWKDRNLQGIVQLHMLLSTWEGVPTFQAKEPVPADIEEVLQACFQKNQKNRPSASQLLQFPAFKEEEEGIDEAKDEEEDVFDMLEDSHNNTMTNLRAQMERASHSIANSKKPFAIDNSVLPRQSNLPQVYHNVPAGDSNSFFQHSGDSEDRSKKDDTMQSIERQIRSNRARTHSQADNSPPRENDAADLRKMRHSIAGDGTQASRNAANPFASNSANPFPSGSANPFASNSSNPFASNSSNPFASKNAKRPLPVNIAINSPSEMSSTPQGTPLSTPKIPSSSSKSVAPSPAAIHSPPSIAAPIDNFSPNPASRPRCKSMTHFGKGPNADSPYRGKGYSNYDPGNTHTEGDDAGTSVVPKNLLTQLHQKTKGKSTIGTPSHSRPNSQGNQGSDTPLPEGIVNNMDNLNMEDSLRSNYSGSEHLPSLSNQTSNSSSNLGHHRLLGVNTDLSRNNSSEIDVTDTDMSGGQLFSDSRMPPRLKSPDEITPHAKKAFPSPQKRSPSNLSSEPNPFGSESRPVSLRRGSGGVPLGAHDFTSGSPDGMKLKPIDNPLKGSEKPYKMNKSLSAHGLGIGSKPSSPDVASNIPTQSPSLRKAPSGISLSADNEFQDGSWRCLWCGHVEEPGEKIGDLEEHCSRCAHFRHTYPAGKGTTDSRTPASTTTPSGRRPSLGNPIATSKSTTKLAALPSANRK